MRDERKTKQQLIFELEERTEELTRINETLQSEILKRREITEVLRLEENHYKDLADLLPQTVYEADENGNLIFVNRRAFDNFGYTQEDFDSGLNVIQMVAQDSRARVLEAFQKSFAGEKYGEGIEITAQRKDRTTFPALAFSSPVI
jgi:PAS domain S-box-containing protein